jgi:hypothetical protein
MVIGDQANDTKTPATRGKIGSMRYRLRTLLVLLGILPPVIALVASYVARTKFDLEIADPVLLVGVIAWPVVFLRFVVFRPRTTL